MRSRRSLERTGPLELSKLRLRVVAGLMAPWADSAVTRARFSRDATMIWEATMTETQTHFERKSRPRLAVRMAVATLLVITATAVQGQTPSASDIAAGGQLFRQKANCQACHGWPVTAERWITKCPMARICARPSLTAKT